MKDIKNYENMTIQEKLKEARELGIVEISIKEPW